MPQLDFANPLTISQVVWMFVIFGALYAALAFWALPQVGGVIEGRERQILADLDSARVAKEQADAAAAEVAERSRSASAEAQRQVAEAVAAAKAEAAGTRPGRQRAARASSSRRRSRGIAAARSAAMGALREVAREAASTVVARLTGHSPEPARARRRGGRGHGRTRVGGNDHESFFANPRTWIGLAFIMFYVIFGRKIWAALTAMLDKRAADIRAELDEAARLRAEAEQMLKEASAQREQALKDAQAMLEHARLKPRRWPRPRAPRRPRRRSGASGWRPTGSPRRKRPR